MLGAARHHPHPAVPPYRHGRPHCTAGDPLSEQPFLLAAALHQDTSSGRLSAVPFLPAYAASLRDLIKRGVNRYGSDAGQGIVALYRKRAGRGGSASEPEA